MDELASWLEACCVHLQLHWNELKAPLLYIYILHTAKYTSLGARCWQILRVMDFITYTRVCLTVEASWAASTDWGMLTQWVTSSNAGHGYVFVSLSVMQPRAPNKSGLFQWNPFYQYRSSRSLWTMSLCFLPCVYVIVYVWGCVCVCDRVGPGPSLVFTTQYKARPRAGHPAWVKLFLKAMFLSHWVNLNQVTATPVIYYGKTEHRIHMPIHDLLFGLCPYFFPESHGVRNIYWKGVWAWSARPSSVRSVVPWVVHWNQPRFTCSLW